MATMSERNQQLSALILKGYTVPQIAEELGLRNSTVKTYKSDLYSKLNVHNKKEFFAYFNRKGGLLKCETE